MKNIVRLIFILASLSGLAVLATVSFAAGGTGPGDALIPTGGEQTVAPNSRLWFRFDYGGNKSLITAALDSNDASDLSMFVYTPDEIRDWQNGDTLVSIGQGTPGGGHDLNWTGRFNFGGTFYISVRNNSSNAITFTLNVTGDSVTTVKNIVPTPTPLPNPFATTIPVGAVNGGTIYFEESAGGNIYRVNADGTGLTRVTYGIDPAPSPDGKLLAFARQGTPSGLFLANADGSNERVVYGANEVRSPSWSPDGSRIVFATIATTTPDQTFCRGSRCFTFSGQSIWKLREYNLNDNTTHDVFTPPTGGTSPTYNADDNTIAFVGATFGLMLTKSDNSITPYTIAGSLQITDPNYNPLNITAPVYSPDGSKFVFMVSQNPTWQVAMANADGSNVHLLTSLDPFDFAPPNNVAPTWSPDGSQVLFLSNRNGKWEFFAMNADGTNLRQVLKNVTDQITINYTYSAERMATWK